MTAALQIVRTVRRLTDGEAPSEVRQVAGYTVESGVPIPPANKGRLKGRLTRALEALAVGESLVKLTGQHAINPRTRKALLPKEYTGRKLARGFRIWRTK